MIQSKQISDNYFFRVLPAARYRPPHSAPAYTPTDPYPLSFTYRLLLTAYRLLQRARCNSTHCHVVPPAVPY